MGRGNEMANNETSKQEKETQPDAKDAPKMVPAAQIFAGAREICIEHDGEIYRLRITRRNKLILQK